MPSATDFTKFLILCLVWGLTWIAIKVGVDTIPPMLFAATRFIAAGVLLLVWGLSKRPASSFDRKDLPRLIVTSLLMITLCYGPLFWGMKFVASGTAAVLEMSLTPLALLAFGIVLGAERWSAAKASAMVVGVIGLVVLFAPTITGSSASTFWQIAGLVAVAWAAIASAWGSVLARPLISRYGSALLSGSTTLLGGVVLLAASLALEPHSARAMTTVWGWQAIAGWLFLVVFGSLVGYSIYMQLLRDIGPARAGSFAFVSPAIAVGVGALLGGEPVSLRSLSGMVLMLVAAAGCLFADHIGKPFERANQQKT